jgi:heme-degrading monooxygenase HmoA
VLLPQCENLLQRHRTQILRAPSSCSTCLVLMNQSKKWTRWMFIRFVSVPAQGKFLDVMSGFVQAYFPSVMVLVSDRDDNRVFGISFWDTREDAEQYHRTDYPKAQETVRPLLDAEPVIRTFDVHSSTTHKISAYKAA